MMTDNDKRLVDLLSAVHLALWKAKIEYDRLRDEPSPAGECWSEFEGLDEIAREYHALPTTDDCLTCGEAQCVSRVAFLVDDGVQIMSHCFGCGVSSSTYPGGEVVQFMNGERAAPA